MRLGLLFALLLNAGTAAAQDDVFDFMPEGGRTILLDLLATNPGLGDAIGTARGPEDWLTYLSQDAQAAAAKTAAELDEWQRQTLADYLGYAGAIMDTENLVRDGRDMTLERCQSCHIVTVVVTQSRTRAAWLGTMNKPSHIKVPLTEAERGQLADYLVVNAGLPIDAIPPELRAGGASY